MSAKHPIIAVTGSSGARYFHLHQRLPSICSTSLDTRRPWSRTVFPLHQARDGRGDPQGPGAGAAYQLLRPGGQRLRSAGSFSRRYGQSGTGIIGAICTASTGRCLSTRCWHLHPGRICPARRICCSTKDCMAAWSRGYNVARHVDFLIGVVPIVNLEWIRSSSRHLGTRATPRGGDRLHRCVPWTTYINFITPQFSRTTSTSSGCRPSILPTLQRQR